MTPHPLYETELLWNEGRQGSISSAVLNKPIEVATPPEFPKGIPGIWSPEHLLVAAVSSCLMTTFLAIAENSNLPFISYRDHSSGKLEIVDQKYMISEIILRPVVTIADEADRERAEKVLRKSEANCLISRSVKSKITMEPLVLCNPVPLPNP